MKSRVSVLCLWLVEGFFFFFLFFWPSSFATASFQHLYGNCPITQFNAGIVWPGRCPAFNIADCCLFLPSPGTLKNNLGHQYKDVFSFLFLFALLMPLKKRGVAGTRDPLTLSHQGYMEGTWLGQSHSSAFLQGAARGSKFQGRPAVMEGNLSLEY